MSLQDKISGVMAHPGQDPVVKDNLPRWVKFGARVVGSVGGYVAIFLGVWNCEVILTGNVEAIVAGIWQIVAGLIVISCEAQCKKVQKLSDMVEQRPYWNRALAYVALAVPPILLDIGFTTIFGSGLIFITGVVYGMMALGTNNVEVIVARIWQIVAGFLVSYCEAQCCCMEHVQKLCDMVDQRPLWNRALAYVALAVMPIILDKGVITIGGNLLIFITGVLYGMAALVTKADRQDMAAAAVGSPSMATSPGMVGGGNIGNTDHHTTLMEDPDVWRPT
ncbi:unnamed protein product [Brassicogethes aeneus]|uniref:Calcium channel flower n=1 Tax=Brassicogethes aeneus TaxID=1431903 RepID=A0A9P0BBE4_BRAAE|nr:unnamed protein product [Brassicogethes aeneus]